MKKIVQTSFTGIDALTIAETPTPTKSPFSVMVENKYIPVLPWDWLSETGRLQAIHPVSLPTTIGFSFAGIVRDVGLLRNAKLIDRPVFGANPGGTASEIVNSQIPPLLFEIPTGVTLQQAATIIGGADTAWHAVNDVLHINQHDRILIIGASGGVGQYLLQLSKLHNAIVFSTAAESSRDFVLRVGSDDVIVYDKEIDNQLNRIATVNKVIDAVGDPNLLTKVLGHIGAAEVLSLSQSSFRPPKLNQHFQFTNGRIGLKDYDQILNLLKNGDLTAYIQQIFPFERVIEAQKTAKSQHSSGRVLLSFNQD